MRKLILLITILLIAMPVFAQTNETDPGITPDSPFYGLDRAIERIQLALTQNKAERARMGLRFANERLQEVKAMIQEKRHELADKVEDDYEEQMEQVNQEIQALGNVTNTTNTTNVTDIMQARAEIWLNAVASKIEQAEDRIASEIGKGKNASLAELSLDTVKSFYASAEEEYNKGNYTTSWMILHNIKVLANRVKRGLLFRSANQIERGKFDEIKEAPGIEKKMEAIRNLIQSSNITNTTNGNTTT